MPNYVNCSLCSADETEPVISKTMYNISFTIVKCQRCGLVYMNPRPTEDEIEEYYYKVHRKLDIPKVPEDYDRNTFRRARERAKFLEKAVSKHNVSGKTLLDVGCATGNLLLLMRDKGWETVGIEPGGDFSRYARERGLNILTGTLDNVGLPENYFDVVTLLFTLEHMVDPVGSLLKIKRVLKDNGVLFVDVPNMNYPRVRLLDKKPLEFYFQPPHIYYFSPKTFREILEKAGFTVLSLKTINWWVGPPIKGVLTILSILSYLTGYVRNKFNMGFWIVALARKELPEKG